MFNSIGVSSINNAKGNYAVSASSFNAIKREQKQNLINEQYKDIYEHEQAHKREAGELGGAIVIERNSDGIPVGGHVDVKMPVLDRENPQKTIKHADKVIKSAMAPKEPSAQDYKVASDAREIKSEAETQQDKNNYSRGNNNQTGRFLNFVA